MVLNAQEYGFGPVVSVQTSVQVPEPGTAYWKRIEAMPEPLSVAVAGQGDRVLQRRGTAAERDGRSGAVLSMRRAVTAVEVVTLATPSVATTRKS